MVFCLPHLFSLNCSIQRLFRAFTSFLYGYPLGILSLLRRFWALCHIFQVSSILLAKRRRVPFVLVLCK